MRIENLVQSFQALYGADTVRTLRAPARINILGEHIDYVSYLPTASLPFGSHEHEMFMAFRPNESGTVCGASMNQAFDAFQFSFDESGELLAQNWTDFVFNRPTPISHWSNYVKGAVVFAQHKHKLQNPRGFDFLIDSTIPPQGGSSSSSALVVLAGMAMRAANEISFTPTELANDSAQAEWFIGTRGGSLDHTAICLSQRNHVIHLNYSDNHAELLPLPSEGFRWVTFFSHAADKGKEIMLEYNERAAVARLLIPAIIANWEISNPQLFAAWNKAKNISPEPIKATNQLQNLMESALPEKITLAEFQRFDSIIFNECQRVFPALVAERLQQPLKIRARALHHIGEVKRVREALKILQAKLSAEETMQKIGALLNETHASLRDNYEVSTLQVNQLIEIILSESNVYGARLIGGGFGGNVLALVREEFVPQLIARVQKNYYAPQNRDGVNDGAVMIATPGDGARQYEEIML